MQGQSHKNISNVAKTVNKNVLRALLNKLLIMQGTRSLSGILLLEGNALFNDALNTFYLRLYIVRHMIKDHSNSERVPTATTWATFSD